MTRTVLAVALAATVVLAGCGAFAGGQTARGASSPPEPSTFTPIGGMVTATQSPAVTPTPMPVDRLAPGLTQEGIEDAAKLARAHAETLSTTSYTYVSATVVFAENGTRLGVVRGIQYVSPDRRFNYSSRFKGDLPPGFDAGHDADAYSNGTMTIVRFSRPGSTTASTYPPDEAPYTASSFRGERYFYSIFSSLPNATVVGAERRNGRTLYRLRASGGDLQRGVSGVVATALIDSRGVIHELHLEYDAARGEWSGRVKQTIRYRDIGETTVTRPGWVDEAAENATRRDF